MYSQFQKEFKFEDRQKMSNKLMEKFEGRIPCIVEKSRNWGSRNLESIDKRKFLIPIDITMSNMALVIRRRTKIPAETALIFYVGERQIIPKMSDTFDILYANNKSSDGFLYISYSIEKVFG